MLLTVFPWSEEFVGVVIILAILAHTYAKKTVDKPRDTTDYDYDDYDERDRY